MHYRFQWAILEKSSHSSFGQYGIHFNHAPTAHIWHLFKSNKTMFYSLRPSRYHESNIVFINATKWHRLDLLMNYVGRWFWIAAEISRMYSQYQPRRSMTTDEYKRICIYCDYSFRNNSTRMKTVKTLRMLREHQSFQFNWIFLPWLLSKHGFNFSIQRTWSWFVNHILY